MSGGRCRSGPDEEIGDASDPRPASRRTTLECGGLHRCPARSRKARGKKAPWPWHSSKRPASASSAPADRRPLIWANAWRVPADRHASCPGLEVLSDASHMLSDLSATIMESTARENRRIPGTSCATGSAKPYQVIRRLISKRLPCPCIQPRLVQKRRVETGGRAAHRTRRAPREIISKPDGRTIQSVREAGGADRAVVRTQALVPARARGRARYPPRRSNRPRLKQPSAHMAQCRRSRASTRNAGARVHARDGLAISFRIEAIDYPRDPESKTPRTGRGV